MGGRWERVWGVRGCGREIHGTKAKVRRDEDCGVWRECERKIPD